MLSRWTRASILAVALLLGMSMQASAQDIMERVKAYPIEFTYAGEPFTTEQWAPEVKNISEGDTRIVYTSPDGKLRLTVDYITYADCSAITEVKPVLECVGAEETAIVEDFRSLVFKRGCDSRNVKVRRITGSQNLPTDFCRQDVLLQRRHECDYLTMTSNAGRSTAWLPYLGVDFDAMNGIEIAIGWTGTWRVDMHYGEALELSTSLLDRTHFKMLPGERFQMPYTVIYERHDKTVEDGLVDFHRYVLNHKSPKNKQGENRLPWLPLTASGGNKTDENMIKTIEFGKKYFSDIPFDVFWVDAGWYGPGEDIEQNDNCGPLWGMNVGDWRPNTWAHPKGNMKRVSDAARKAGMKFLLWFEPERATFRAPIVKEHPEYFLRTEEGRNNPEDIVYLTDLGNPEAWQWVVDEVARNIRESHVDIYRQDFNCDPLPHWREADTEDRRCVSEIKHINGLYAFWDELHRLFPDMEFENCASGGTRMDIEMFSRAYSYCRDDYHMQGSPEETTQNITLNTTSYLPITGGETFAIPVFDTYGFLSCLGASTVFTPNDFGGMVLSRTPADEEVAWFRKMLQVTDRYRHLFFGDFYALTHDMDGSDIFCAYQLNDTRKGEGFFIVFRREACPDSNFFLQLRGIEPEAQYEVETFEGDTRLMKGAELAQQVLTLDSPRSYRLVFYKKK